MEEILASRLTAIAGSALQRLNSVGGGCIADASVAEFADGQRLFVKTAAGDHNMFMTEANSLRELAGPGVIRVPEVVHAERSMLVLEVIDTSVPAGDFMAVFGRQLARLHRCSSGSFGFFEDNYIGATPQLNTPVRPMSDGWPAFYFEYRLLYQLRLAETNGHATSELIDLFNVLESRLYGLLAGCEEPPALLHGDLWSGNYMVAADGAPCLIDPAVYYGHREADLGMTKLFGGFGRGFYEAYEDEFPQAAGAAEREGLYKLYHLLNHLNLFGSSYYGQCVAVLRHYCG